MTTPLLTQFDRHATRSALRSTVREGLRASPKTLPAALFYDFRGAALFDDITRLPEYYITRTELSILEQHANTLAAHAGEDTAIIELGSGVTGCAYQRVRARGYRRGSRSSTCRRC